MSTTLVQQRIFEKRYFTLTNTGVHIRYQKLFKLNEYDVPFENIGSKAVRNDHGKSGWLIAAVVFFILSLSMIIVRITGADVEKGAEVFYMVIGAACLVYYFVTSKRSLFLSQNGKHSNIEFLVNIPSKEKLENFVEELLVHRNNFLLLRYGKLSRNLNYQEQYQTLQWLLDIDVMGQEQFRKSVEELDQLSLPTTKVKGFLGSKNEYDQTPAQDQ